MPSLALCLGAEFFHPANLEGLVRISGLLLWMCLEHSWRVEPVLFSVTQDNSSCWLAARCHHLCHGSQDAQARTEGRKVLGAFTAPAFGDLKCGQACAASAASEFGFPQAMALTGTGSSCSLCLGVFKAVVGSSSCCTHSPRNQIHNSTGTLTTGSVHGLGGLEMFRVRFLHGALISQLFVALEPESSPKGECEAMLL